MKYTITVAFLIAGVITYSLAKYRITAITSGKKNRIEKIDIFFSYFFEIMAVAVVIFAAQQMLSISMSTKSNSRTVLDFSINTSTLKITNLGFVPIKDISVYATKYSFSDNLERIDSYQKISGPVASNAYLNSGNSINFDLSSLVLPTSSSSSPFFLFPHLDDGRTEYFCLRVIFRNSNNNERLVYFMINSLRGGVQAFGSRIDYPMFGPFGSFDSVLKMRDEIIRQQMLIYNDNQNTIYGDSNSF